MEIKNGNSSHESKNNILLIFLILMFLLEILRWLMDKLMVMEGIFWLI